MATYTIHESQRKAASPVTDPTASIARVAARPLVQWASQALCASKNYGV
jgi:hypothetical protein